MSIEIKKKSDTLYTINGKEIYQDGNSNWIAREELTGMEYKTFAGYLNSLETEKQ